MLQVSFKTALTPVKKSEIDRESERFRAVIEERKREAMTKQVKIVRGRNNTFRDLGFPEEQARTLLLRSQIMICIEQFFERSGLTQGRAAVLLGLTQPRLNALLKGKIDQFSLDALVNTATRAGLHVELHVTSPKRAGGRAAAAA